VQYLVGLKSQHTALMEKEKQKEESIEEA